MDNIRPIKNEEDSEWALAEISRYFDSQPELCSPDAERFDVLAALIEAYEEEHHAIEAPGPPARAASIDATVVPWSLPGRAA